MRSRLREGHFGHEGVLLISCHLLDVPLHKVGRLIIVHSHVPCILYDFRIDAGHLARDVELGSYEGSYGLLGVSGF